MKRRWSKSAIAEEVYGLYAQGDSLSYSSMSREHLALLRAATRYFGSWQEAVEFAGLNYEQVRRYQSWTRERILIRIRELHDAGADLSWRNVSTKVEPQLAAAATKKSHFGSWRAAIQAAGLNYAEIRRYKAWTNEGILDAIRDKSSRGEALNAKEMSLRDMALLTAARRRFQAWHSSLDAAGLDHRDLVQRKPAARMMQATEVDSRH